MGSDRIRSLFLEALNVAEGARAALLDRADVSEAERTAVRELLACDPGENTDSFLQRPIEELRRNAVLGRFGPYELQEIIGRGGMGAVYKASRADGEVRQIVAIKCLDREWLDPKAIERFRRERQILSGLAHPNIARLLDAGTREDGRPYLVMELIEGEPIDVYCKNRNLGPREILALFLPVCRAVAYAHSKLVIHRDLKPSNILVASAGEPKLLDFGIARALDATDPALTATVVLTPYFASPDQARGEAPSTAADIYGLGAVLYALLTGCPPHRVEGLSAVEAVRRLCEVEPDAPSALRPELKGDLENILRKAMDIEPDRRYGSVRELAQDIERYIAFRPVLATPASPWYRVRRFVQRHRALVAASVTVAAALTAGGWSVLTERQRADEEAAIARAVNDFLQTDLLSQAGLRAQAERNSPPDPDLKVRTVLDRASASVSNKFGAMPKVEASIRTVIGSAYLDQGLDLQAETHFRRAVEIYHAVDPRSSKKAEAVNRLADLLAKLGRRDEAEAWFRQNLETQRWPSREQQLAMAHARFGLATVRKNQGKPSEALPLMEEALRESRALLGPAHERTLAVAIELAVLYNNSGQGKAAEELLKEVLSRRRAALGESHPDTLYSMSELGVLYRLQGRKKESEELLELAAKGFEAKLGADHPETVSALNNLAISYGSWGRYSESTVIYKRILAAQLKLRGPEHPDTLSLASNLAVQYRLNGNFELSARLSRESLAILRPRMGETHPATLLALRNLGAVYREMGRTGESARLLGEALETTRRVRGVHLDTARAIHEFARTKIALGRYAEAEDLLNESLAIRNRIRGADSRTALITRNDLATVYLATGRAAEAERLLLENLETGRKSLGAAHPDTLDAMSGLAQVYRSLSRFDDASALQKTVWEQRRNLLGERHPATLRAGRELASMQRAVRKP